MFSFEPKADAIVRAFSDVSEIKVDFAISDAALVSEMIWSLQSYKGFKISWKEVESMFLYHTVAGVDEVFKVRATLSEIHREPDIKVEVPPTYPVQEVARGIVKALSDKYSKVQCFVDYREQGCEDETDNSSLDNESKGGDPTGKSNPFPKVVRDGKVAVIYLPEYGGGWYLIHKRKELVFHPALVDLVERNRQDDITDEFLNRLVGAEDSIYPVASKLQIEWVPEGTTFRIDEYEGAESVVEMDDDDWFIA